MKHTFTAVTLGLLACIAIGCSPTWQGEDEQPTHDQDTTHLLPWEGDLEKFLILPHRGLTLNDPTPQRNNTACLYFASTRQVSTRWSFKVCMAFVPSSRNHARFYLTSSRIPGDDTQGHYLLLGGQQGRIMLCRQTRAEADLLIESRPLLHGDGNDTVEIAVEHTADGRWMLHTRLPHEPQPTKEGNATDENPPFESHYCGIVCVYTPTRNKALSFHQVKVHPLPEANTPADTPSPSSPEDLPSTPSSPQSEVRGSLLFNEIMFHPAPDGAEYIEIYNPASTELTVSTLYLYWMRSGGEVYKRIALHSPERKLTFPAQGCLCFTAEAETLVRKHGAPPTSMVHIPTLPALNNEGGFLALSVSQYATPGLLYDKCRFDNTMHSDSTSKLQGVALEKTSPQLSSINRHWKSSSHPTGGTPGRVATQGRP